MNVKKCGLVFLVLAVVTAAWTSDCKARWGKDWIGTEAYTRTFTQLVRWLSASEGTADVQAHAELDRGVMSVTVDAYDADAGKARKVGEPQWLRF